MTESLYKIKDVKLDHVYMVKVPNTDIVYKVEVIDYHPDVEKGIGEVRIKYLDKEKAEWIPIKKLANIIIGEVPITGSKDVRDYICEHWNTCWHFDRDLSFCNVRDHEPEFICEHDGAYKKDMYRRMWEDD